MPVSNINDLNLDEFLRYNYREVSNEIEKLCKNQSITFEHLGDCQVSGERTRFLIQNKASALYGFITMPDPDRPNPDEAWNCISPQDPIRIHENTFREGKHCKSVVLQIWKRDRDADSEIVIIPVEMLNLSGGFVQDGHFNGYFKIRRDAGGFFIAPVGDNLRLKTGIERVFNLLT